MELNLDKPGIANAMFSRPQFGTSNIDAAYTYLGQFIAHELLPSTANRMVSRQVSGALNLDSIYGCSFENMENCHSLRPDLFLADGTFRLSEDEWPPRKGDLFRKHLSIDHLHDLSVAAVAEMRNDANLIVAQLHRLLLRFHNKLVRQDKVKNATQAREVLTKLFQLVLVCDYFPRILSSEVYDYYFVRHKRFMEHDFRQIPAFFSLASFRFGHSMVRQSYTLNQHFHSKVKLPELMAIDRAIPEHHLIDWQQALFSTSVNTSQDNSQKALKIDTNLSFGMANVEAGKLSQSIVEFNLQAAQQVKLDPGLTWFYSLYRQNGKNSKCFRELQIEPLMDLGTASFRDVDELDITTLPLWLYVLLEAQMQQNGNKLGGLASTLNAEVLINALSSAHHSIYSKGRFDLEHVTSQFPDAIREIDFIKRQQFTLPDLISFATEH